MKNNNQIPWLLKGTRGYVILAMQEFEYEQATALAYSIKIHNKDASVTLVTNYINRVPHHYHKAFDRMINLPYSSNEITRVNDWQLYWATPYVHNIVIDCASLVKENHDSIWEYLENNYDIYFFNKSFSFKGAQLENKKLKVYEEEYDLNAVYSHMFYFKYDTELALSFFKLADVYMQNWRDVYATYFSEQHRPATYVSDITHSLINTIALFEDNAIHNDIIHTINMPVSLTDGVIGIWDKWTDRLNVWNSVDSKVKIQNFAIATNLYYGEQEFMTEDIFNGQQDTYNRIEKS
tara:strand:+ start:536 stop:1414 length:879 start_codon:yes stop_codon:yes gene_type:complete